MWPEEEERLVIVCREWFARWWNGLEDVQRDRLIVFDRAGHLLEAGYAWRRLGRDQRRSWQGRIGRMFVDDPRLRVVVVSELAPEDWSRNEFVGRIFNPSILPDGLEIRPTKLFLDAPEQCGLRTIRSSSPFAHRLMSSNQVQRVVPADRGADELSELALNAASALAVPVRRVFGELSRPNWC